VVQKSLDTRGNTLHIEYQDTFSPRCIRGGLYVSSFILSNQVYRYGRSVLICALFLHI